MEDVFDLEQKQREIKEALQTNQALAVAKIREILDRVTNIPLNIAVTGEAGSGKSTFINALRGVDDDEEEAAKTGLIETTMEIAPYPHPNHPNVKFWDLPGVGTMKYPAADYVKKVRFERFDFFIIISADRFTENDVKLTKEIQRMGKKFYFVRSKIDNSMRDGKRKKSFNEKKACQEIREYCTQSLQAQGVVSPQVFLLSNFELHLYEFPMLEETLERELPQHKRGAFLLAMPNMSLEIINRKKTAFQAQITLAATLSAVVAGVPIPGFGAAVDLALLFNTIKDYKVSFGLDVPSLKRLAHSTGVDFEDLRAVMASPLAKTEITPDLVLKVLVKCATTASLMAAEECCKFIPIFGIPLAMVLSFAASYWCLKVILDELAKDAHNVFRKALGLVTAE
ncbi:interferon-inducible GTPase 5-like [Xyrichtys novacula]|uniref:Interferon-inducible GTPase 5-like n=1 Tax=Xyrichtys novacula TaxID=13765 RepID=A0AAV1GKN7_XYRNO|nr:interferon-inducible GTPase 5-like [Xyrichtys novacula]